MAETERALLIEEFGQVLHRAIVEIRNLAYGNDSSGRIRQVAEIVHNVPLFLIGRDDFVAMHLKAELESYEAKYGPKGFTQILDMDEAAFTRHCQRTNWEWPEPVEAEVKS